MNLEARIEETRKDINRHYTNFINLIEERKNEMLNGLNTLKCWLYGVRNKMDVLEQTIVRSKENIAIPICAIEKTVSQLRKEIKRLQDLIQSQNVEFVWDKKIESEIANIGALVVINRVNHFEIMDVHMQNKFKVHSFGEKGEKEGNLNHTEGIAFDPVYDRIIAANCGNNSLDILSLKGGFISRITDDELQGPNGVATYDDDIYTTNMKSHCVTVHNLKTGVIQRKFGRQGKGDLEFSSPRGITIATKLDGCLVYIADKDNYRLKVLTGDLRFVKHVGSGQVNQPRDVKIFKGEIYVLDGGVDACIKVFNENDVLERQFMTQGIDKEVLNPWYFEIDFCGNLLISDNDNCNVLIHRECGECTKLGGKGNGVGEFRGPTGITISMDGRIIVADGLKEKNAVQIFYHPIIQHLFD